MAQYSFMVTIESKHSLSGVRHQAHLWQTPPIGKEPEAVMAWMVALLEQYVRPTMCSCESVRRVRFMVGAMGKERVVYDGAVNIVACDDTPPACTMH